MARKPVQETIHAKGMEIRVYTQDFRNYKRVTESHKGGAANRLHLLHREDYVIVLPAMLSKG